MQPYATVRERIDRQQAVILDGGIGSVLVQRGVRWRDHGLRTDSSAVQALHEDYLNAGAHVLRTNTFQLNRRIYQNVFRDEAHMRHIGAPDLAERVPTLIPRAVGLAQAARIRTDRRNVAIAGVMSPLEHCFRPDLAGVSNAARTEHAEIARLLANAGVDLLLLESMNALEETRCAVEVARATGLPVWVSFAVGARGDVLSGEPLAAAAQLVQSMGADVVLGNAAPPPDIGCAVDVLASDTDLVFGAYAHIGQFDPPSWKFEFFPQFSGTESWSPERYLAAAESWRRRGARVIGGCCGTGPDHIRALVDAIG